MARRRSTYAAAAAAAVVAAGAWVAVSVEHPEPTVGATVPDADSEADPPTAVFIGDSFGGAGSTGVDLATLVARGEGWEAVDLSRGGTGYLNELTDPRRARKSCGMAHCPTYADVIPAAGQLDAEVVVVSGGRNDTSADLAALAAAITDFYVDLREALPRARIYAISPLWDDDPVPKALGAIRAEVRESVKAVGGTYVDIGDPLAGRPRLVAEDGVHPNGRGNTAIARAILEELHPGTTAPGQQDAPPT